MKIMKSTQNTGCESDGLLIKGNKEYYEKFFYTDIVRVEASGSYSTFFLKGGSRVVAARRLALVEKKLPASHFVRVHRSFIVNWHYIDGYTGTSVRVCGEWFPIGNIYRKKVLLCMNVLDSYKDEQE